MYWYKNMDLPWFLNRLNLERFNLGLPEDRFLLKFYFFIFMPFRPCITYNSTVLERNMSIEYV